MDVGSIDLQLLRALLTPQLRLEPGRALLARVVRAETAGARGALSIAGTVIDAELPRRLAAGDEVRLVVREMSADRVLLSLATDVGQPLAAPVTPHEPPRTREHGAGDEPDGSGSAQDAHSLALRYLAPAVGPVDFRFGLDPGGLRLHVSVGAGGPYARAAAAAGELERRLADALGRPVSLVIVPRDEPVDVYA